MYVMMLVILFDQVHDVCLSYDQYNFFSKKSTRFLVIHDVGNVMETIFYKSIVVMHYKIILYHQSIKNYN